MFLLLLGHGGNSFDDCTHGVDFRGFRPLRQVNGVIRTDRGRGQRVRYFKHLQRSNVEPGRFSKRTRRISAARLHTAVGLRPGGVVTAAAAAVDAYKIVAITVAVAATAAAV